MALTDVTIKYVHIPSFRWIFLIWSKFVLGFRVPGSDNDTQLTFLDDTGASRTKIFTDDLEEIVQTSSQRARFLRHDEIMDTHGQMCVRPTLELECCLIEGAEPHHELTPWTPTEVSCDTAARAPGQPRLGGPFLREMVYTATAPSGFSRLYISRTKTALTAHPFPSLDITQSTMPISAQPLPGAMPHYQWRNLLRTSNRVPPGAWPREDSLTLRPNLNWRSGHGKLTLPVDLSASPSKIRKRK